MVMAVSPLTLFEEEAKQALTNSLFVRGNMRMTMNSWIGHHKCEENSALRALLLSGVLGSAPFKLVLRTHGNLSFQGISRALDLVERVDEIVSRRRLFGR